MLFFFPPNSHDAGRNKDGWHDPPTGQSVRYWPDGEPGTLSPPLLTPAEPACLLQTHRHRSSWGKRDLTHFKGAVIDGWWTISNICVVGVYSECLNQPLSSWAKVIRPDPPLRHTLQLCSRPFKSHGEYWIKSKYLPVMQTAATVWENYQAEQRVALHSFCSA